MRNTAISIPLCKETIILQFDGKTNVLDLLRWLYELNSLKKWPFNNSNQNFHLTLFRC